MGNLAFQVSFCELRIGGSSGCFQNGIFFVFDCILCCDVWFWKMSLFWQGDCSIGYWVGICILMGRVLTRNFCWYFHTTSTHVGGLLTPPDIVSAKKIKWPIAGKLLSIDSFQTLTKSFYDFGKSCNEVGHFCSTIQGKTTKTKPTILVHSHDHDLDLDHDHNHDHSHDQDRDKKEAVLQYNFPLTYTVSTRRIAYPEGTSWYKQSWPDVSTPTSWRGQKISRHFLFINIFYVVFHFLFKCTIALRGQKGLWPFRLWVEVFWQEATPFGKDQFRSESKLKWPPQPHLSEKGEKQTSRTPGRILMQNILRQNTVKQRPWWYFGARQHKQGK